MTRAWADSPLRAGEAEGSIVHPAAHAPDALAETPGLSLLSPGVSESAAGSGRRSTALELLAWSHSLDEHRRTFADWRRAWETA